MGGYGKIHEERWQRCLGLGLFLFSVAWLTMGIPPGLHWHDTAEFTAVGQRLSISHPPGHPIQVMLTHLFERLPLGSIYIRAHWLSAVLLSLGIALYGRLLSRIAPRVNGLIIVCFAALPLFMPAVWLQGIRSEVYGLQLFLTVVIAWILVAMSSRPDGRYFCLLSLVFGFAGANHSLLGLMWVPLALVVVVVGRYGLRQWCWASFFGAVGLSTYAYLPLRATAGGEVGWGQPDTFARVWEMISAREWSRSVHTPDESSALDTVGALAEYGVMQFGAWGSALLLLVTTCAVLGALRGSIRPMLAMAYLALTPFAFRLLYAPDILNPDLGGYLAAGFMAAFAMLCLGLNALDSSWQRPLGYALGLAVVATFVNMDRGARHQAHSADGFARQLMAETPPDGVLIYSDYASYFQGWALRAVEAARPDLLLLFRGQINRPWFRNRMAREYPDAVKRLMDFPASFTGPDCRFEPGVRMAQLRGVSGRLRPVGLTLAADVPWPETSDVAQAFSVFENADADGSRNGAFLSALHGEVILRQKGPKRLMDYHLQRLEALAPTDDWVARLKATAHEVGP